MKIRLYSGVILLTMLMTGLSLQGVEEFDAENELNKLLEKEEKQINKPKQKKKKIEGPSSQEEVLKEKIVEEKKVEDAKEEHELESAWWHYAPIVKGRNLTNAYWLRVPHLDTYNYAVLIKMKDDKKKEYPTIQKKDETTWEPKNFDYINSYGEIIPISGLFLWGQAGYTGITALGTPVTEENLHELTYQPNEKITDQKDYFKIAKDKTAKNVSDTNFDNYKKQVVGLNLINPPTLIAEAISAQQTPSPLRGAQLISAIQSLKWPTIAATGALAHYLYLATQKNSDSQQTSNLSSILGKGALGSIALVLGTKGFGAAYDKFFDTKKISIASCDIEFNSELFDVNIENRKKYLIAAFDKSGPFHDVDIICFQQWPTIPEKTEEAEKNRIVTLQKDLKKEIKSRGYLLFESGTFAIAYKEKKFTEQKKTRVKITGLKKNTLYPGVKVELIPLKGNSTEDGPRINLFNIDDSIYKNYESNEKKRYINETLNTISKEPAKGSINIICGDLGINTYVTQYGPYKPQEQEENIAPIFSTHLLRDAAKIGGYDVLPTTRIITENEEGKENDYFVRQDYIYYASHHLTDLACLKYEYYPSNLMYLLKPKEETHGYVTSAAKWIVENPLARGIGLNWLYRSLPGTDKSSISGRQKEYFSNHAVIKAIFRIK